MPWLTPDSIPEEGDCRPLFIPADSTWLALVSGALTELTKPYNWQQFGSLTVQQTVDRMQQIVDSYYDTACASCTTPGGYRATRISSTGHVEQLNASGEWEAATDDYVIPSPTARTEGTAPDQNCLAAKNATNVLSQLYESLSESYASEFSTDEAITAFIAAAVAIVGFEFAPITWSIAAFGFVFFEALFRALAYITADLWTEEFSKQFECLLLECVINTAGVVTFDWDCFNAKLSAQVNSRGLSEVQMRLYVQIGFVLHFIGGVDGLNLAARTTDITNDDCSFCNDCPPGTDWCADIFMANSNIDGDFAPDNGDHSWTGNFGAYINDTMSPPPDNYAWATSTLTRGATPEVVVAMNIFRTLPSGTYTKIDFDYAVTFGTFTVDIRAFEVVFDGVTVLTSSVNAAGHFHADIAVTGSPLMTVNAIASYHNDGGSGGGGALIQNLQLAGTGTMPAF